MNANPGLLVFESGAGRGNMLVFGGSGVASQILQGGGGGSVYGVVKRRGFYGLEELMAEDEYYDDHMLPEKKRRLTRDQVQLLEQSFEAENKLEPERKCELAKKLGLPPRQIAIWFQNRRARWKNKQLEHEFDVLKASYDSLLADHDTLLADNQQLRSEVTLLTEKLEAKRSGMDRTMQLRQPSDEIAFSADATIVASSDAIPPASEDRKSSGSTGSDIVDKGESLPVVASSNSCFMEPEDGGSFDGGSGGHVYSEEDDGSDDGGAYFPSMFEGDHHALNHDHVGGNEEDANIIGWWMWN